MDRVFAVLKAVCLLLYAGAAARLAGWLPAGLADSLVWVATLFLAVHVLEVAVCLKAMRRLGEPLASTIAWTLLFGLLYWKPILDRHKAARQS